MIKILDGDLLESGASIIAHQVNCSNAMNSGVAKQIREKYPEVFLSYKTLCDNYSNYPEDLLGMCDIVKVEKDRYIANLFGQLRYGYDGKQYTKLEALKIAMKQLRDFASKDKAIAFPYKIGSCRGGSKWEDVYAIIEEVFDGYDVEIWRLDKG